MERVVGGRLSRRGPPGGRFPATAAVRRYSVRRRARTGNRRRKKSRRSRIIYCRWCVRPAWPISRAWYRWKAARSWTCRSKTDARRVDVGELTDAEYQPGRYLRGVFEQVGTPPAVKIDVARPAGYPLPAAIVQRAEFFTLLSADGASQTQARFTLHTKAIYLEIKLPEKAELWSAQLLGPGGAPKAASLEAAARGRQPVDRVAGRRRRRRLPLAVGLRGPSDDRRWGCTARCGCPPRVCCSGPTGMTRSQPKCRWPTSNGRSACPAVIKRRGPAAR